MIVIILALAAIVAAMLLVRRGWGGDRASAAIGWALTAAALVVLTIGTGAWGLATGTVVGMVAALSIVLHAGWIAPAKTQRTPRDIPSVTIPHRAADIARRLAVFALVVPVAFAAAQWLTFGVQALARRGGAVEADTTTLTLFLQPVVWSALMAWQMTRPGPSRMIAAPAGAAVVGTLLWSLA